MLGEQEQWNIQKESGNIWLKVHNKVWYMTGLQGLESLISESKHILGKKGNILKTFDDLKALTKPLEEFEFDVHSCHINKGKGWYGAIIHIAGNNHTLAEAEEIHSKLGRVIHTARIKEK